jgi:hypothetical protein
MTTAIGGVPAHWKQMSTRGLVIALVFACVSFGFFYAVLHHVWKEFDAFDWDSPAGELVQYETDTAEKE